MIAYKENKFIVFEFPDGKHVKYDLSSGETIGKLNKPVKSLNNQLRGYEIHEVIDSFQDENYKAFLRFILLNFVNDCRDRKYNRRIEVNRVKNIGTFLSRINFHSRFEQFFAAGIHNVDPNLTCSLSDIPKQLQKFCKQYSLRLDNDLIDDYVRNPALFRSVLEIECNSLSYADRYLFLIHIEKPMRYRNPERPIFYKLMEDYNYNPVALVKYLDHLITYEALVLRDTLTELHDYCQMMSTISPKYDKYPRNFLTSHRIATRNYERLKAIFDEPAFLSRIDVSLEWKNGQYSVIYPRKIQDIRDEAVMQNNCVASYVDKVIEGRCHIVFLRYSKDKKSSLVTMEIKNNEVVQAKGKFNRDATAEELSVIEKYNKYLEKRDTEESNMEMMVC